MSKNENPKIVLKMTPFSEVSEHNALNFDFLGEKSVTIFFGIFDLKYLGDFFCILIEYKRNTNGYNI